MKCEILIHVDINEPSDITEGYEKVIQSFKRLNLSLLNSCITFKEMQFTEKSLVAVFMVRRAVNGVSTERLLTTQKINGVVVHRVGSKYFHGYKPWLPKKYISI